MPLSQRGQYQLCPPLKGDSVSYHPSTPLKAPSKGGSASYDPHLKAPTPLKGGSASNVKIYGKVLPVLVYDTRTFVVKTSKRVPYHFLWVSACKIGVNVILT